MASPSRRHGGRSDHLVGDGVVDAAERRSARQAGEGRAARRSPQAKRQVYDPALGKMVDTPVYWRFDMAPGARIKGPAIIAEDETSTIVGANFRARIDSLGYIVLERAKGGR